MESNGTKRLPVYIGGVFSVIAGLFFVLLPEISSGVIGIMFGIILIVAGISEVIGYIISIKQFREENYGKAAGAEIVLVYSLILIALGVFFLLKPDTVLQLLTFIVGIFFLIDGIVKFRQELFLFNVKDLFCWALLFLAFLLIFAGIALLINPFDGTRNVIVFSGCAFIVSGFESVFLGIVRKIENKTGKT